MPISKATIEKMAAKLGIKADEVQAALANEADVEIAIPEVDIFTTAQLTARDNIKYNEGKEAGEEMAVKSVKEANNLQFQGKKVESLYKHLQTIQAPDESETVKKMRDNLVKAEQERDAFKGQMSRMKLESTIHGYIPELNNGMSKTEAMAMLQANGFDFKEEGGSFKAYRHGQLLKDEKMLTEVPANEAVGKFFTEEKKWVGSAPNEAGRQGRGGESGKPRVGGVSRSIKEVETAWVAEHGEGSINGMEYAAHLESKMKEAKEAGQELA